MGFARDTNIEASQRLQESLFYIQVVKEMESQRGKLCTGDIHYPRRDVPTSK